MKRLITAVSFAVLATSAAAADRGKPFEQLDVDRALPTVAERSIAAGTDSRKLPYEQVNVNRALYASAGSSTRSDVEIGRDVEEESAFAADHNFIAPAQ